MAKNKLVKENEKIAEAVVGGYKKIEDGVVEGLYQNDRRFCGPVFDQGRRDRRAGQGPPGQEQAEQEAAGRHKPE